VELRDTDTNLDYYRGLRAEGSDWVGYSESTLKRVIAKTALSLPGARVIELGAGPNPVVPFALAKAGRHVTAVEISADFCETARLNAKRQDVQIEVICASAHDVPLPDGSAEIVILTEVLEHVPDDLELRTLREAYRLVAPGGDFVISVPNANSLFARWNDWRNGQPMENDEHLREYTVSVLRERVEQAGFQVMRVLRVPNTDLKPWEQRTGWLLDLFRRPEWSLKAALVARKPADAR
jgi:2-polyprenyl-3-methyl-5-hydroxy-6-metoxy-1,4-benzoquinol methylase